MDAGTAAEALRGKIPAEVLDLITLHRQERGVGLGVNDVDRLERNPHLVVCAVQPAAIDDAAPSLAVLLLSREDGLDLCQSSVPGIEGEARLDIRPGALRPPTGRLFVGRRWFDGVKERSFSDGDRLVQRSLPVRGRARNAPAKSTSRESAKAVSRSGRMNSLTVAANPETSCSITSGCSASRS